MSLLDPLLVFSELLLDLVEHLIERGVDAGIVVATHEVVLVLGGDEHFDERLIAPQIDGHFNSREALEDPQELG